MPVNVTKEMRDKISTIITDHPLIKRTELIIRADVKEWYVAGTVAALLEDQVIFKQVRNGAAYYCSMSYAIDNGIPTRIVNNKASKPYTQPNAKDVSLLASQLKFNQLFQASP
tara:strand:- start:2891 stop:3229 length:339 start_codon:yes stop_codon:yes gene_type:complete